jgi:hypothetical protein
MNYSKLDDVIDKWAKQNSLLIYKKYQDNEVRSTSVVSPSGEMFQIWIDPPDENDEVGVHVWDRKNRKRDWRVSAAQLSLALDEAAKTAKSWMRPLN